MTRFRDDHDRPVDVPPLPDDAAPSFYVPIGAFQGATYDRNAFTRATEAEVDALVARTGLRAGDRVLDVGCGTGRHLRVLAARGIGGVGLDVSGQLLDAARLALRDGAGDPREGDGPAVRFVLGDARQGVAAALAEADVASGFDVAWTLCQGAFGTSPSGDRALLAELATLVRPGGRVVLTAFHALFAVRHLVAGQAYDPVDGVLHHRPDVHGPDGAVARFDLWTTAWTASHLVEAVRAVGLEVDAVVGAEPGRYDAADLGLDDPELLVVATRPA